MARPSAFEASRSERTVVERANSEQTRLVERAQLFATRAHERIGQRRRYTGEPYITHPAAVAALVASVAHTPQMLAAAWLHDTVEDTDVSLDDIEREFGSGVAQLVSWLTEHSRPQDGNRATRKRIERAVLALAPADAQTVKLADIIENCSSILEHDAAFAPVYVRECRELVQALALGDAQLRERAVAVLSAGADA
jgi:(p)ppGpp synthase/HD superfamily hydrolase